MKRSHLVLGIVSGCGCLLVVLGLVGAYVLFDTFRAPSGVVVDVSAPLEVSLGERFEIEVSVVNAGSSTRTLVDVDVATSYLEGVAIESSVPEFSTSEYVPIDETISYSYDLSLPAGEGIVIRYDALAVAVGDHVGDFDVCIDTMVSCLPRSVRTTVRE